ncbi:MAG: AI-2E family transporter [Massiliimalia sp.]
MNLDRKNMKRLMLLIVFAVVIFLGIQHLSLVGQAGMFVLELLAPFLVGGAMAFIINVPMRFLERVLFSKTKNKILKKFSRILSFLLTLILILGVLAVVMFLILPELGKTLYSISATIPVFLAHIQTWAEQLAKEYPQAGQYLQNIQFDIDWEKLITTVFGFLKNGVGSVLSTTVQAVSSVANGVFNTFVSFVFAIYLLMQKEKLGGQVRQVLRAFLPEHRSQRVLEITRLTERTFSKFLSGQCMEAVILGTMFFVAMSIFRFPYALLVGVLIAVTALIPIFGAFIGCFVGAFLILMVDPMKAVWFVVMFLVIQQLEGNLIYPHVVGGSIGLPSIWVLVAVTLGGSLMGVLGMLLFIPLSSVLYTLFREMVKKRLKEKETPVSPEPELVPESSGETEAKQ